MGDAESVIKCVNAKRSDQPAARSSFASSLLPKDPVAVTTMGIDDEVQWKIVDTFTENKPGAHKDALPYFTETRFTKNGIERTTVSDFGLIGSIIANLAPEE